MNRKKLLPYLAGVLMVCLPFVYCFSSGKSFAPYSSFEAVNIPYADGIEVRPPNNHFWVDTMNFYLPRLHTLSRGEFPISFSSGGGGPLYADTISGFFSPYSIFVFGLLPLFPNSLDLYWMLGFLVFFSGLYFWFIALGLSPRSSLLAALTQSYCTAFFPGSYSAFQTLGPLSFLVWALWAEELGNKKLRAWLPFLFLTLGFYAGNFQTGIYPVMIYFIWMALTNRALRGSFNLGVSILAAAPLWLTGFEYHILRGVESIADRKSQVPEGTLGKIKALLALPALLLPSVFGSSKSIDLLKGLNTSATYFIGSIGFVGPLLIALNMERKLLKKKLFLFGALLLFLSLILMISPALNFVYYRILSVFCFGLSCMLAASFEDFQEGALIRKKGVLRFLAMGIFFAVLLALLLKNHFREEISLYFSNRLSESKFGWWPELKQARIEAWFQGYFFSNQILFLPVLLVGAWYALRLRWPWLLVACIFLDTFSVWKDQVTFDDILEVKNPAFEELHTQLKKSPSYPISRYVALECIRGKFLFHFVLNEFQAVPSTIYYGSTNIQRLPSPKAICDKEKRTLTFPNPEDLANLAANAVITRSGWTLNHPDYYASSTKSTFTIWSRKNAWHAIQVVGPVSSVGLKNIATESWSRSHISWKIEAEQRIEEWKISLPYYPGWTYRLDGKPLETKGVIQGLPHFQAEIGAGHHIIEAYFFPRMIWIGLIGTLMAFLAVLWRSISTAA